MAVNSLNFSSSNVNRNYGLSRASVGIPVNYTKSEKANYSISSHSRVELRNFSISDNPRIENYHIHSNSVVSNYSIPGTACNNYKSAVQLLQESKGKYVKSGKVLVSNQTPTRPDRLKISANPNVFMSASSHTLLNQVNNQSNIFISNANTEENPDLFFHVNNQSNMFMSNADNGENSDIFSYKRDLFKKSNEFSSQIQNYQKILPQDCVYFNKNTNESLSPLREKSRRLKQPPPVPPKPVNAVFPLTVSALEQHSNHNIENMIANAGVRRRSHSPKNATRQRPKTQPVCDAFNREVDVRRSLSQNSGNKVKNLYLKTTSNNAMRLKTLKDSNEKTLDIQAKLRQLLNTDSRESLVFEKNEKREKFLPVSNNSNDVVDGQVAKFNEIKLHKIVPSLCVNENSSKFRENHVAGTYRAEIVTVSSHKSLPEQSAESNSDDEKIISNQPFCSRFLPLPPPRPPKSLKTIAPPRPPPPTMAPIFYAQNAKASLDYTSSFNPQNSEGSIRKKQILRSKSDATHERLNYPESDIYDSENTESFYKKGNQEDEILEEFFESMGLEKVIYNEINHADACSTPPVYFESISSSEYSNASLNQKIGSGDSEPLKSPHNSQHQPNFRWSTGEPSIIEKNARVVKWLVKTRKANNGLQLPRSKSSG